MSFLKRIFGGKPSPEQPEIDLPSGKYFPMEVVGESNYQATLERICGPRTEDGANKIIEARLVLEDANQFDNNAVRVEITGKLVGYLSREMAVKYRAWLTANGHGRVNGKCQAKIKGGWDRGGGDVGSYGVYLDVVLK